MEDEAGNVQPNIEHDRNQRRIPVEERERPRLDLQPVGLTVSWHRKFRRAVWGFSRPASRRRRPHETQSRTGVSLDRWQAGDYGSESNHEDVDPGAAPGAAKKSVQSARETADAASSAKLPSPESVIDDPPDGLEIVD
jgi:hypothetical protein